MTPPSNLPPTPTTTFLNMFVARESGQYSYLLMDGMIAQTLTPCLATVEGVNEVLEQGIAPLTSPETCGFDVRRHRAHRTNASVFTHKGSVYVYSLGSAAAVNTANGDNAWVRLLCDLIVAYRPRRLHVANFSRLLRCASFMSDLMTAVETAGTVIVAGGFEIDLNSTQGRILWQTLSMVSDLERDMINQRLFAGLINKYLRGAWVLGAESVPPGYKVVDGKLALDRDQVDAVRDFIRLLADPTLSDRQIIDAAGASGLSSPTIRRHHGEGATFTDVRRSGPKVNAMYRHLETWQTGTLELRIKSAYRGVTQIRGVDIVDPDPPLHHGFAVLRYDLEAPEGGWATDEIFDRARGRRAARADYLGRGAPRHKPRRRPFSGWARAVNADGRTEFLSGTAANYILMREEPPTT